MFHFFLKLHKKVPVVVFQSFSVRFNSLHTVSLFPMSISFLMQTGQELAHVNLLQFLFDINCPSAKPILF